MSYCSWVTAFLLAFYRFMRSKRCAGVRHYCVTFGSQNFKLQGPYFGRMGKLSIDLIALE